MNLRRPSFTAAIFLFLGTRAYAHRLDEYLQATMISLEKDRVQAVMRLTPGVAVSSFVLRGIDSNDDGVISPAERQAYAERVLRDLSFSMNGHILKTRLISVEFPGAEEMRKGLGEIQIEFSVDLPHSGPYRRLVFANHHQTGIAAYLVNSLVPRDRDIKIVGQNRNEQQSLYQLDYVQAGDFSNTVFPGWQHERPWLGVGLLLLMRLALLSRGRLTCASAARYLGEGIVKASGGIYDDRPPVAEKKS
jgi:hypothetical protein